MVINARLVAVISERAKSSSAISCSSQEYACSFSERVYSRSSSSPVVVFSKFVTMG